MPLWPGMDRSITSTSSSVVRTRSIASRPLAASPDHAQVDLLGEELPQAGAHDGVVVHNADFDHLLPFVVVSRPFCVATCRYPGQHRLFPNLMRRQLLGDLMRWLAFPEDGHQPDARGPGGAGAHRHQRGRLPAVHRALDGCRRSAAARAARSTSCCRTCSMPKPVSAAILLTGDARYLEPYNARRRRDRTATWTRCRRLYAAAPGELAQRWASSPSNVPRKLAEMDMTRAHAQEGNEDAWKFVLHDRCRQGGDGCHPRAGRRADRDQRRRH